MMALAPQLTVAGGLMSVLTLGAFAGPSPRLMRWIAALSLVIAALMIPAEGDLGPLMAWDGAGRLWNLLFFLGALPLLSVYQADDEVPAALVLGSVLGMSLLSISRSVVGIFLGLELMSLPAYLMVWSFRRSPASLEAAVKYFFAGGVAGALFMLGAALNYSATGSLQLDAVRAGGSSFGLALMAAAALFKLGAFPLHFWLPDVYEASRPELTGFLSTSMKAAAVLMLMRLIGKASAITDVLPLLAAATMTLGNIMALRQTSLQRLLAYSSIAHVGYILLGLASWTAFDAIPAAAAYVWFYLAAYTAMSSGAFMALRLGGLTEIRQLKGLGARSPRLAAYLALFLVALAGFPPTAGFLAKFMILWDALRANLVGTLVIASVNTLVGMAYYFKLIRAMYFEEPEGAPAEEQPVCGGMLVLAACAGPTIVLGLYPDVLFWVSAVLAR